MISLSLFVYVCVCRYHLQALRHMYVLAADLRVLVTIDTKTDSNTSVPVCVDFTTVSGDDPLLSLNYKLTYRMAVL